MRFHREHRLKVTAMTPLDIMELVGELRPGDVAECMALNRSPRQALEEATKGPGSYACGVRVGNGYGTIGAFGVSGLAIWSLWSPLKKHESREIFERTPSFVRHLVQYSGAPTLTNIVLSTNKPALLYLRHSGCFDVQPEPFDFNGHSFYSFRTKPLEELPA